MTRIPLDSRLRLRDAQLEVGTPANKRFVRYACAWQIRTQNEIAVMACTNPFEAFRMATESLDEELYLRASYRGVMLNLIGRDEYKMGTGLEQTTFTIGRSEPTTEEEDWQLITNTSGQTYVGTCGTSWNDVNYGFEERVYHPEQFGLRGPVICKDDLIYNFKAARFLETYMRALAKRSYRSIENRYSNIYIHFSHKHIARADFRDQMYAGGTGDPPDAPSLPSTLPPATCELSQEMLDYVASVLNEEGATDPNTDGWINLGEDGPIYPLWIGQDASHRILFNNSDRRQDYRDAWSGEGNGALLLKRVGATKVIGNFRHVINLFPPRYNYFTGIGYVRIPTWIMPAGTQGFVAEINPSWRTAAYEGAYVLNPWVFRSEVIRPVNSAAGLNWEPTNYFGEWQFRTGPDVHEDDAGTNCYDPLHKTGRHFAEYKHAPRPIFPEFGRFIIFKRCPTTAFSCATCTS